MNASTISSIATIKKNGWYPQSQTLGEGGWSEIHWAIPDIEHWKRYMLFIENNLEPALEIKAKDDKTALSAFKSQFCLEAVAYQIVEKIVQLRTVKEA